MAGAELIRLVRRRGVELEFVPPQGKISHGTRSYGSGKTIRKDRKKEPGSSLLADRLRNPDLDLDELRSGR